MAQEREVHNMQSNLATIRKLYGWTIEELASKIGVTKQTISNIENNKTELSKVQYIALRAVLEAEASMRSEEEKLFLYDIISRLIDAQNIDEEEHKKTEDNAKLVASAIAGGAGLSAAIAAIGLLTPAAPLAATFLVGSAVTGGAGIVGAGAAAAVAGGSTGWLIKMLKKEKKENGKNKK